MKKYPVIIAFAVLTIAKTDAQQLPQYTQYLINDYVINPAIGGTQPFFQAKSNNRYQWTGITDAPRTYVFSLHGPLSNLKMGVGGYVFTDITGPTRRTGARLSYSYLLNLTDDIKMSFGVSGGLLQFAIDGGKITSKEAGDIALSSQVQSVLVPDAGAGFHIYSDKYFFSFSVPQLMQNKLKFFDNYKNTPSKLVNHYFAMAGYRHQINDDIMLEPSVFVKYVKPVPLQLESSIRVIYKNDVWLATSYRTADAFTVTAGYIFQNNISVAYSYDYTLSGLRNYSSGTHEVMLGIRFKNRSSSSAPTSGSETITE